MLKASSKTSFYLNNELIDISQLEYQSSKPNGARNHKRAQAVCKLKLFANQFADGHRDADEETIKKWIKEAK